MRILFVGLLVCSSVAAAQHRQHRERDRELGDDEIFAIVADSYRQVLQREPEDAPAGHLAYWGPRLRGMSKRDAKATVTRELYSSEEYRCLRDGCSIDGLLGAIRAASFSSDRIGLIESAAGKTRVTVAQLKQLVLAMAFSSERTRVLELLGPRVTDKQNVWMLDDALPFASEREAARRSLSP